MKDLCELVLSAAGTDVNATHIYSVSKQWLNYRSALFFNQAECVMITSQCGDSELDA